MEKGKIIFLNGVSCTGKTTLAKKLQEKLSEPFYSLSSDTFVKLFTPKKYLTLEGDEVIYKSMMMLPRTIKNFSDMGLHTIVDIVFIESDYMKECVELLREYPVLFVHVTCALEEHRRRAKESGVSIEWIEWQSSNFIPQEPYDITIDTSKEECVDEIIGLLNHPEKFTAFKTLWERRIK